MRGKRCIQAWVLISFLYYFVLFLSNLYQSVPK